ncbi:hypothetical protein UFOVP964_108 [uncultured Caudovirales phage]|uniref:Uncharacterized protein n=1 Tax=uncultured Caudovirales phage TaxID=2100421 RepID=A0A6J7XND1_9CAUD|nr:hypothetical protein UFOVP854_108 [uncultured Caudovirales phage]CAB4174998.1 hypothetical protein UFOVP964_108 [uncultured Caudovirales phage]CAB4179250.1 hypothetical protein UFOVP1034_50 [uncultured Caudovirales phage]CAB4189094.1 hypothetical protein UFOVP1177_50 [uncultured Caudovirales phage]CAB4193195.1 hypothetical protein UFOVP1243_37 [uncultured Caudovirales phage]
MSRNSEFSSGHRMCPTCGSGPMEPMEYRDRTLVRTAPLKEGGKRKNQYKYGPVNRINWMCPEEFGHAVTEHF